MVHGRVVNYLRGQCITSIICARGLDHRKCGQQARTSTSFVDNTTDLPRRNFLSPAVGTKFQ